MKGVLPQLAASLLVAVLAPTLPAQEAPAQSDPALVELAGEFHAWLDASRPVEPHAVLRTRRPPGWSQDWSSSAIQQRKQDYLRFQGRLKSVNLPEATADRIDAMVLAATMERIHWTLEVLASPRRDPGFYLDQSLGSLFEVLVRAPEPGPADVEELIRRLHRFPQIINEAKLNLDRAVPLLADTAIARIGDVDTRIDALEQALSPYVGDRLTYDFNVGIRAARQAMNSYKGWLELSRRNFREPAAIGAQRYRWFLGHVALVPDSPDALAVEAGVVQARAGAQLAVYRHRFAEQPEASPLGSMERFLQMADISKRELGVFLESARLVALGGLMDTFAMAALPSTLQPLVADGELFEYGVNGGVQSRLYVQPNRDDVDYVESLAWADPRLLIAWKGVPGRHAQYQAAQSNPRSLRHRAGNASLGDGLALYAHEQVMDAGLYAFRPASQVMAMEVIRYHAALAQADIRLASEDWTVADASEFLVEHAGLDPTAALRDVTRLVAHPGLAGAAFAAYTQAIRALADASGALGEAFSLGDFNQRLLLNSNVPVALQRWELLGLEDELDSLTEQRGRPATVPE